MIWQARHGLIIGRAACDPPAVAPPTYATLDGTPSNTTLSGGNLIAAHSNGSQGGARTLSVKNSGLYYFEVTLTDIDGTFGSCVGIIKSTGAYSDAIGTNNTVVRQFSGQIVANGGVSSYSLGTLANGDIIGMAVNLSNPNIWFRKSPSGLWNGDASANPVTLVNGVTLTGALGGGASAGPILVFGGTSAEAYTANFGASAFSGTVPSGFTSGWPA